MPLGEYVLEHPTGGLKARGGTHRTWHVRDAQHYKSRKVATSSANRFAFATSNALTGGDRPGKAWRVITVAEAERRYR